MRLYISLRFKIIAKRLYLQHSIVFRNMFILFKYNMHVYSFYVTTLSWIDPIVRWNNLIFSFKKINKDSLDIALYPERYTRTLQKLFKNEPCHDKTYVMRLRPAWIQTSLRIRAVWSGSMLFAYKPYNK
jgi:hypothetical protein